MKTILQNSTKLSCIFLTTASSYNGSDKIIEYTENGITTTCIIDLNSSNATLV